MPLSSVPTTHLEAYFCSRMDFPGSGRDLSQLIVKMRAWRHPALGVLCRCSARWLLGGAVSGSDKISFLIQYRKESNSVMIGKEPGMGVEVIHLENK